MKMKYLSFQVIRNCSHYSNVQTILLSEKTTYKKVIKKSFSSKGAHEIDLEYKGISAFCNKINVQLNDYVIAYHNNGNSAFLITKYIKGDIGDCHSGIKKNEQKLKSLINFYKENKMNQDISFCHGDLSVANVIFNQSDVAWIIDWENYNEELPIYYDLVYCITELMLFDFSKNNNHLDAKSVSIYWELYELINGLYNFPIEIKFEPAKWIRRIASGYILDNYCEHLKKCPFIRHDIKIINELDNALTAFWDVR